ncbi:NFX1-type zinc finger-containing protein 1 [Mytilus coruscus]|uniref:NFX1-type zinc finger-containing protein 1 n=1 Tax=Mytilus coruscus TaxID=42192 RepID=A0A6J8BJ83_MYTCO|nr:NFX1-type zinc finger-containing protein 1 [Mytilus coruscus]
MEQNEPDYFKSDQFVKEGFNIRCLNSELQEYKIDISSEANWPDADEIGMDDSQYRAFVTSMKSKFALIQGPPGTGKTVVGLKIAELLLKNDHIWREQSNEGPMLLLSYTNHALDNFLLDISKRLRTTDTADIVGLGSRSEVELLREYNLTIKRKAYSYKQEEYITHWGEVQTRTKRESSGLLNVMAFNARTNLKIRIKEHNNLKKLREEIQTGIVHQDWLHDVARVITDITQQVVTIQQNCWENIYEEDDFDYFDDEENRCDDQSGDYDEEGIQTIEKSCINASRLRKTEFVVSSSIVNEEKTQTNNGFGSNMMRKKNLFSLKNYKINSVVHQLCRLKKPAASSQHDKPSNELTVRVTSVDNFQGEENEIILLSLVRSNIENKIGHLAEPNRVCVALSRAKIGLYAIGNFELLKAKSRLWNDIVKDAEDSKSFGTRLQLTCQNHKNSTYISKSNDFDLVVDGGCQNPCSARRPCGHLYVQENVM